MSKFMPSNRFALAHIGVLPDLETPQPMAAAQAGLTRLDDAEAELTRILYTFRAWQIPSA